MGLYAGGVRLSGNIHEVEPGALYRSAQLNGARLKDTLARYHIRTVINLRGTGIGKGWYDDEVAVSSSLGVQHMDVALTAGKEPDRATLKTLVRFLKQAPQPILIHCNGGADRSGLAAGLYEFLIAGKTAREASGQLSFAYGHFPWLISRTGAMDSALARVETDAEDWKSAP